jgi:hypothetical protein
VNVSYNKGNWGKRRDCGLLVNHHHATNLLLPTATAAAAATTTGLPYLIMIMIMGSALGLGLSLFHTRLTFLTCLRCVYSLVFVHRRLSGLRGNKLSHTLIILYIITYSIYFDRSIN